MTAALSIGVIAWLGVNTALVLAILRRGLNQNDRILLLALLLVWLTVCIRLAQRCGCAP
jgi:hypothetical protein